MYIGNFAAAATVRKAFNTEDGAGNAVTLLGSPTVAVYKDGNLTQVTTGTTLTVDYDSVTGLNMLIIDTSADGTFYAAGSDYKVVLSAGTVAGVSVVGKVLVEFSIDNRLSKISSGTGTGQLSITSGSVLLGDLTDGANDELADAVFARIAEEGYTQALATKLNTNVDVPVSDAVTAAEEAAFADIPVNQVPVPELRTWTLKEAASGLVDETARKMAVGEAKIFAIDFSADLPTNGRLVAFDSIAIDSGTAGGVTFNTASSATFGVDKSKAKAKITAVTAGTYEIEATVSYTSDSGGGTAKAKVTLVVGE